MTVNTNVQAARQVAGPKDLCCPGAVSMSLRLRMVSKALSRIAACHCACGRAGLEGKHGVHDILPCALRQCSVGVLQIAFNEREFRRIVKLLPHTRLRMEPVAGLGLFCPNWPSIR
jgi:hypothetical protein